MNATDYLMFNVVFIGNNLSFVSSRFNMCNKFISIRFAINIEPVRPSTTTHFLILAHCVIEFDTPDINHRRPSNSSTVSNTKIKERKLVKNVCLSRLVA